MYTVKSVNDYNQNLQYRKVTSSSQIPIGFTIQYAKTVLTKEWDEERLLYEELLERTISSKERTVGVYALIMMSVKYI